MTHDLSEDKSVFAEEVRPLAKDQVSFSEEFAL